MIPNRVERFAARLKEIDGQRSSPHEEIEAKAELASSGMTDADINRLAPHKVIPGNQPSNTLMMRKVTPEAVGALIALYEHRTYVQGVIWDLDSFDQWGVELGKKLGENILPRLLKPKDSGETSDSATDNLIALFRSANGL